MKWIWDRRVPIIGFIILGIVFSIWFGLPIYLMLTKGSAA